MVFFTLAIFLVSIWLLATYVSSILRQDMQRMLGDQQLSAATFVATDLNDDLDDRLRALKTFADGLPPTLLDRKTELQTALGERSFLLDLFNYGVIIVDVDGTVIADVPLWHARIGLNLMDRDYVASALKEGRLSVGRPVLGRNSGLPSISMAAPIRDRQGKVIGAVAGLVNLAEPSFMDHVSRHGYGKSGDVLVASRQHRIVITGSDQRRVMEQLPAQGVDPSVDARAAGREGTEVFVNLKGIEVLSSAKAVPAADWFVEISLPTEEAFSPIRDVQRRLLIAASLLTLLAGVMSWWMVRRELSPMLVAVNELARSQPNQRQKPLTITRQDEIGKLLGAFNRAVVTLDQHDALMRQILDTSSVAIFLVDMQGRITQANRRMAEMFGYSLEALLRLEYVTLVDPDEREVAKKSMLALLASAVPAVESDRLYWRADRSTFWGHLSGQRFVDADGLEQGLIGVIADISARKATEELVKQHDNRLTAIIENFPGGISMIDTELRLVAHNQQFKKLLDFPDVLFENPDLRLEDIFRFNARRGEYGPGADVEQQVSERVARARKFEPHKFERIRPDGTVLEIQGAQVPGGGFVTIYLDITERKRKDDAIRNSELSLRRFRVAMDATQDAIYIVDRASMRFVDVNASACNMLGMTHEQVMAAGPDGVLGTSREELANIYDSVIANCGVPITVEVLRTRQDGTNAWVEISRHAQRSDEDWTIVTVARDITERKRAEQALREGAQELRLFADNVPAMTAAFDANLNLIFVNKRYADSLAHGRTDLIGKHLSEVVGESVYREIEGYFLQALQGHPVTYQRAGRLQNHEMGHLQIKLMPNIGEQGKVMGCFAVTTDITEHKQTEERIQRVAHHDSLTGLPNRLLFGDRLEQAISMAKRESRQFALLYLDLDKFKPVNDTLGHAIGDELLQAVAERIRRQVRESDTVARIGGDEFAVILFSIARTEEAQGVADKISAAIATPFQLSSQKEGVTIGVSIGITIYPTDGTEADMLIEAADQAMYRAKEAGGRSNR
jgi:diguanylate cyclase (GGDEF)-like protein/PAS domain S-box-containing protein